MVLLRKTLNSYFEVADGFHHFRHVHLAEVFAHCFDLGCEDVGEVASVSVIIVVDVELDLDVT